MTTKWTRSKCHCIYDVRWVLLSSSYSVVALLHSILTYSRILAYGHATHTANQRKNYFIAETGWANENDNAQARDPFRDQTLAENG